MKKQIVDQKNWLTYAIFSLINKIAVRRHFRSISVEGRENIPKDRAFVLISNHISRWDGLLVYHVIGRPSNFMVSPNELRGLQGLILQSMGAFPASSRFDLHSHIERQIEKKEGIVIFPEGDIYRDGATHPFKSGAARFALSCAKAGHDLPIVPVAIRYSECGLHAKIVVAQPVTSEEYMLDLAQDQTSAVRALTERLYREVCYLRVQLGCALEKVALFSSKMTRSWANPTSAA